MLDFAGRAVVRLAGTETLRRTSLSVDIALVVTLPKLEKFANANAYVGGLMPSLELIENGLGEQKLVDFGVGMETLVGNVGADRWSGKSWGLNLPYLSPWVGERAWGAVVGLPFVASFGVGRYENLGSYVSSSTSLPLGGMVSLGFGAALFYPPLDPVIEKVRPYAERVQKKQTEILSGLAARTAPLRNSVKRLGRRLKRSKDARSEAIQ